VISAVKYNRALSCMTMVFLALVIRPKVSAIGWNELKIYSEAFSA
jgi:hypothetical protein